MSAPLGDPEGAPAQSADASQDSIWRQQKLIRNAELRLEVEDVVKTTESVKAIAGRHDGIVADSESSGYGSGERLATISVRVPAAQFEVTMADLRSLGTVLREAVATQDVTKEYFDLETRLSVKRSAAERLREILATRTGTLADVIAAESELARVTGEIEQMEGEKRFYDHRIATSTIRVAITESQRVTLSFVNPVRRALQDSGRVFVGSLQAMIYLVTALIPWLAVGFLVWRIVLRVKGRLKPPAAA